MQGCFDRCGQLLRAAEKESIDTSSGVHINRFSSRRFKAIPQLRAQGLGVVVISHNIDVVFEVADRIVVLYVGRHAATFEQATIPPRRAPAES
jgi:ABC-type uncharacterized transport system ATPase subunit